VRTFVPPYVDKRVNALRTFFLRCLIVGLALWQLPLVNLAPGAAEVAYEAQIVGVEDDDVLDTLTAVSRLLAETKRPPPTVAALRRRAEDDLPRLQEALASLGYYGATVGYEVDDRVTPARVTLRVELGEPYRLTGYTIAGENPALHDWTIRITDTALGIEKGMVAASKTVVDAEGRLLSLLAAQAYPLAKVEDRKVVVDHAEKDMTVEWRIATGPHARFGEVTVTGLQSIDEQFVRSRLPWKEDAPFDGRLVDEGRQKLVETSLFSSVRVAHGGTLDGQGRLPVTVTLAEAKHRSIGGGLSYSTSEGFGEEGFGGKAFWEHRNLFGAGERLAFTLEGGQTLQSAKLDFRKPDLTNPDLAWLGNLVAAHENREAYESLTYAGSGGVEYDLTPELTVTGALSLEYADIDDGVSEQVFTLLGTPTTVAYDTTDDLLDPTKGTRLNLGVTPYVSVANSDVNFVVTRLSDSIYVPLHPENRVVLAGWGRVGTILGADSTEELPATKRLYGGGAGSVRAYGFQELGPVAADGDPAGGRSQLELGVELRWRMFEDFGGAVFFEGGDVYDDPVPDPSEGVRWGAGLGLRYFTGFGPIRADVAFPINPRDSDEPVQFYIGLGQAF
jgi:translocation and assembly module TamA